MEFTKEQLKFIQNKRPELIKKKEPSLNTAIVEFLKKYEVFVKPPKDKSRIDGAIAGAITGFVGADAGGDAFMISGQKKQTATQEWTQWKQWALDHKDFPKFQTEFFDKVHAYNEKIDRKLQDLEFQKEMKSLIKNFEDAKIKKEKEEVAQGNIGGFIIFITAIVAIGFAYYGNYVWEDKGNDYSFIPINLVHKS